MIDWSDRGIVLAVRAHGESGLLAVLLTREHGRHAGLLTHARGGRSRTAPQPGQLAAARWQARLADHLGRFTLEVERDFSAAVLDAPLRLAALASAAALVDAALPEREPQPALFDASLALLGALAGPAWAEAYVLWELGLLGALGFGLDLSACAVTGGSDDLAFVSPRSGRAVSAAAAAAFRDRLLTLPGFLAGRSGGGAEEVTAGLDLTGHFLDRHVFGQRHRPIPAARTRFVERYGARSTKSGSVRPHD